MSEFKVYWSFDDGRTLEHIGYEKLDENGNYVFKRVNIDTKELRKDWHLGMLTNNQGDAKFYRFPYIGKTDIEDNKIYADSSIFEFDYDSLIGIVSYRKLKGFFYFELKTLSYRIKLMHPLFFRGKDFNDLLYHNRSMSNFKIIDTLQENKLGLYGDEK